MTRALAPCLALLLAACASSPSPSSAPPSPATSPAQHATPTPAPAAGPLACERDEDCTVFDDCGECKPLSVHTRMEPTACSEVHGPGCGGFIPHCNTQSHTCELHAIHDVES